MSTPLEQSPVRVAHIVHDFEGGGLETLVAGMARGFDRRRVAVSVISLSGRIGRLGRELKATLEHVIPVSPLPLISMVAPVGLAGVLRRTRTEIAHIHSGVWFKGALAARMAGVRGVVFTEHGREHDDPALARFIDRGASRMTDAVVAVSHRLEDYLHEQVGIPRTRLTTIENGVDTDRFAPGMPVATSREAFGIPPGVLVIGSVGRLEPVKAYERLVRAAAIARDRGLFGAPFRVLLCGEGSQRQMLRELADSHGIGDSVLFPGWVADPRDAYRMMDVFVLPSRSEGLSVSLLEAMSTGVPPLVTPVGANREVLGDELATQVVSGEDLELFAAELGRLVSSAERRAKLSSAARAVVVARFSQARMLDAYTTLYERLADRQGSSD